MTAEERQASARALAKLLDQLQRGEIDTVAALLAAYTLGSDDAVRHGCAKIDEAIAKMKEGT